MTLLISIFNLFFFFYDNYVLLFFFCFFLYLPWCVLSFVYRVVINFLSPHYFYRSIYHFNRGFFLILRFLHSLILVIPCSFGVPKHHRSIKLLKIEKILVSYPTLLFNVYILIDWIFNQNTFLIWINKFGYIKYIAFYSQILNCHIKLTSYVLTYLYIECNL